MPGPGKAARPDLDPGQALVLGLILGALTKAEHDASVFADVEPVTDDQGFTDTIFVSSGGERLAIRVTPAGPKEVR